MSVKTLFLAFFWRLTLENNFNAETEVFDFGYSKKQLEKKSIKRVSAAIGAAFIFMILLPQIFSIIVVDLAALTGTTVILNDLLADALFNRVLNIVLAILSFIVPFLFVPRGLGSSASKTIRFSKAEKGTLLPVIFLGLGFCAFGNIATTTASQIFASFGIEFYSYPMAEAKGAIGIVLALLATAVTPALVEEFAMRGVTLGALKPFGEGFAILISALIFGLMHRNFVQIPFAFIVGLALGFAVVKTKSIWSAIIIHFINNAVSVLLDSLFNQIQSQTAETIILSVYFIVCFILFFVGILLTRNKEDFWKLEKTQTELTYKEKVKHFFLSPFMIIALFLTIIESLSNVGLSFLK
ncbi:MAG: CPBP family intramembrane metalloprotease [Ruminococcaceae bacterium]|nr:CPBP family intramembrane metalloprotease [Oscillospiraceae bacterium]